jgi:hypothetical protein
MSEELTMGSTELIRTEVDIVPGILPARERRASGF